MMNNKIKDIALILFKNCFRARAFIYICVAAVVLIFISLLTNTLIAGPTLKVSKGFALFILDIFPLVIILIWGVGLLSINFKNNIPYVIFSKPVSRLVYLAGSFFALTLVIILFILIILIVLVLISLLFREIWISELIISGYLALLKGILLLCLAFLFSLIAGSLTTRFLIPVFFVWGHSLTHINQWVQEHTHGFLKSLIFVINALIPNFDFFNKNPEAIYSLKISPQFFLYVTLYTFAYSTFLLMLSAVIFKGKEI